MRRAVSLILLALVAMALPAASLGATPEPGSGAVVVVEDFAFTPNDVKVVVGQTVTWMVGADPEQHTVTPADGAAFEDSGQLFTGDTYAVRFDAPGAFDYLCTLHPFMTGTVTVLAAGPSAVGVSPSAAPSAPSAGASPSAGPSSDVPAASPGIADPVDAGASGPPIAVLAVLAILAVAVVGSVAVWRGRRRT